MFLDLVIKEAIPNLLNYQLFKNLNDDNFIELISDYNIFLNKIGVYNNINLISPLAFIHKSANIINSYIGPNVSIYENATVRNSIIFDNTVVGHSSEITRSIILSDCEISRFNYIGNSLIGEGVKLIAGAATATLRYDTQNIIIKINDKEVRLNKNKFGSIIGSNTTIGFHSKLNPGTFIGMNTLIDTYFNIKGYIPPNSKIY